MELAKNILNNCKKRNLSLMALSRLSGVKQPTLHGWITGRSVRNLNDLKKVCTVLEIGLHQILFGSDDPFQHGNEFLKEIFQGDMRVTIHKLIKKEGHSDK